MDWRLESRLLGRAGATILLLLFVVPVAAAVLVRWRFL
jgi:hypothetical protein